MAPLEKTGRYFTLLRSSSNIPFFKSHFYLYMHLEGTTYINNTDKQEGKLVGRNSDYTVVIQCMIWFLFLRI